MNDDLRAVAEALRAFASGGEWGLWKAWLVQGSFPRRVGVQAAKELTRLQVAADAALARPGVVAALGGGEA